MKPYFLPVLLFGLFLVAAIVKLVLRAVAKQSRGASGADAYTLVESLFSRGELAFLEVLSGLRMDGVVIVSKVRLADIFNVRSVMERGARQAALNRIISKHVDFLLIRSTDGAPVLAIELDDKSHQRSDRAARDTFVDAVYAATGLPVLHVAARSSYKAEEVRRWVDQALQAA